MIRLALALALGLGPALPAAAQAPAAAAAQAAAIEAEARTFVETLIGDLNRAGSDPKAIDGVLRERVALERIGRYLLGPTRNTATPAELKAYEAAVPAYILADVRGEIGKLVAQSIVIEGVQVRSAGDALVRSRFRRKAGGTVRVDWRVMRGADGALRMVDVYVNGVSRFVIRRDEFQSVVKSGGMPALLKVVSAPPRAA
ncbi:ABC transporter substrate-binding protein [Thermaurantiacus sp.]